MLEPNPVALLPRNAAGLVRGFDLEEGSSSCARDVLWLTFEGATWRGFGLPPASFEKDCLDDFFGRAT
jgi:hypothetical protein